MKKNTIKASDLIQKYLKIHKAQFRTIPGIYSEDILEETLRSRFGTRKIEKIMKGNYNVYVRGNNKGTNRASLIKMIMTIDRHGEFEMISPSKKYIGNISMKNESVVCFNVKNFDQNDTDFYAVVHAIIPDNSNVNMYGAFVWSELSLSTELSGKCFIEKIKKAGKPEAFHQIPRANELYSLWQTLEPLKLVYFNR